MGEDGRGREGGREGGSKVSANNAHMQANEEEWGRKEGAKERWSTGREAVLNERFGPAGSDLVIPPQTHTLPSPPPPRTYLGVSGPLLPPMLLQSLLLSLLLEVLVLLLRMSGEAAAICPDPLAHLNAALRRPAVERPLPSTGPWCISSLFLLTPRYMHAHRSSPFCKVACGGEGPVLAVTSRVRLPRGLFPAMHRQANGDQLKTRKEMDVLDSFPCVC